ncbi:MAG: glycosyltransferase [Candidatus Omnitrophica bacterium]|nr:glycosyltransferase [Candidatus Omnitrophota bacterium]
MEVSVIIPTSNRKVQLKKCVESLFTQEFPAQQAEIIVIDDCADKNIETMLIGFKATRFPLRYFSQNHRGPAAARNLGIKKSSGNIVAFIDDDCLAEKNWLRLMHERHQNSPEYAAVGGNTIIGYEQIAVQIGQFLSTCSIQTQINNRQETIFFPTCNVSIKKEIFSMIQFNEKFPLPGGEDLEFFWRLFKSGFPLFWDRQIIVRHNRDKSMRSFFKQAYNYGRGNYYVQCIHRDHPLLKELKTGFFSFWVATLVNILKIPRFSYALGRRMIAEKQNVSFLDKIKTYLLFAAHKIIYIYGNMIEYSRMLSLSSVHRDNKGSPAQIPRLLILDITHSCNLRCRICDIWKTHKEQADMDLSIIKKLLEQAKQLDIKEIALSGGEPLLRKDILEIIKFAESLKIKNLGILTNGIELQRTFSSLKPYLINNTVCLVISLDSLYPKIHNYIRNATNAWQETMQGIEAILKLKQQYPQVEVNVISIVLTHNLEELAPLAVYLKAIGVGSLQFQGLLANNLNIAQRKKSEFWVPKERVQLLERTIDELVILKEKNDKFIRNSKNNLLLLKKYFRGTLEKNDVSCRSAERTFLVSNQGVCTTCFSPYGDVRRKQLKDIIEDKQITAARQEVKHCSRPCLLPCFCDK